MNARVQVPGYAAYALAVNVLIPYWQQPRMPKDMPETGEPPVWGQWRCAVVCPGVSAAAVGSVAIW
jgi:hypothetical protein